MNRPILQQKIGNAVYSSLVIGNGFRFEDQQLNNHAKKLGNDAWNSIQGDQNCSLQRPTDLAVSYSSVTGDK